MSILEVLLFLSAVCPGSGENTSAFGRCVYGLIQCVALAEGDQGVALKKCARNPR